MMIPIAEPLLGKEELENVTAAVRSGWISSAGKFITEFEEEFAGYCGSKYAVATCNGTVALHLALTALEIVAGDEVIVPALSFIAAANVVRYTGATPVFVDSHPDYWCLDPEKIEEAITPRTKAIIPVHLYGHPSDMDEIVAVARKHQLYVVEDAAEAHGAEYKGKRVGSLSTIACFSFYGNKIITTGEGGMCLTSDEKLAERMRLLRDHAMCRDKKYWHETIGFNYRMTNMQAAVGVAQLGKIDGFLVKKRQIASWYAEGLAGLAERGLIKLHPEMSWARCAYWLYSVLIEDDFRMSRDALIGRLKANGIDSRPFFYPIHIMPPYKSDNRFPIAEETSRRGINLPSGVGLNRDDAEKVLSVIRAAIPT